MSDRRRSSLAVILLVGAFHSVAVAGTNWPQFRGPQGDGHATGKIPLNWSETENVRWKTPIHDRGWSSPVVWGDQVWMTTATDDGKQLYGICADLSTGDVVHDIKVFDVNQPQEKHELNSYASPTPVIEQGRVYLHFGSYGTVCLDSRSGRMIWERRDLPCNHFRGPGSSPILYGDLLIVHYDGFDYQYIIALNKETGETVWKQDRTNDYRTENGDFKKAYSTPTVIDAAGRTQLISNGSKATFSYDPLTGKEYWQVEYEQFSGTARPLFAQGLVIVSTGFSKAQLLALRPDGQGDVTNSHIAWTAKRGVPSKPSPLIADDLIYMVDDSGILSCLEVESGVYLWTERIGGQFSASPVYSAGHIFLFDHEGTTTVIKPGRAANIVARNELDDGCMASPAVVDNALILRTRSHLYRIEQPASAGTVGAARQGHPKKNLGLGQSTLRLTD